MPLTAVMLLISTIGFAAVAGSTSKWQLVLFCTGVLVCLVGVAWQHWRVVAGVNTVAVGLVLVGLSALMHLAFSYVVVCFITFVISARMVHHRVWYLVAVVVGSYASLAWLIIFILFLSDPIGNTTMQEQREAAWNTLKDPQIQILVVVFAMSAAVSIALMWLWGRNAYRKTAAMQALAARAELATVSERNRIAREMHDIVAHSLTAVIAQADGGRYAGRKDPAKAIEALNTIAVRGRDALAQMRGLLSVLHDDAAADPRSTTTTPGVAGVADLVRDAQRNGVQVQLQVEGEPRQLDEIRDLTVYRIVQECLTNVLKHAGSVEATVKLLWQPGELVIQVDNARGEDQLEGSGRGLAGIRERVRMVGGAGYWGESEVYPGGWGVIATIPSQERLNDDHHWIGR